MRYIGLPFTLNFRLCLFRPKRISGNHFTPAYVFGTYRKLGQTKIILCVNYKIRPVTHKTISGFILPSNDFHPRKIEEREKQQEEIAPKATLDRTTAPNTRSHRSRRTPAPARSHSQTILTHTHRHHTLKDLNPPLLHHRSTNTQDLPLRSPAMH